MKIGIPVWLCGGVEVDSDDGRVIRWSQPEIALYDDDSYVRMSYPDLVEDNGCYYLVETQKDKARVHQLDPALLEGLWSPLSEGGSLMAADSFVEWNSARRSLADHVMIPPLPRFNTSAIINVPIMAPKTCVPDSRLKFG